ncbi:MAG: hypothetical protein FJ387_29285 [Verrucomicrobia bacterium]|nr:hypothetical protein [Verrucomicrobiota bacterium]
MTGDWQFILNESSVEFLLACKARQREGLLKVLHGLAANPYQRGDYEGRDSTGRPVQITLAGGFLITFWADSYVEELRVIRIETV